MIERPKFDLFKVQASKFKVCDFQLITTGFMMNHFHIKA